MDYLFNLNYKLASFIIKLMVEANVVDFCIAPGSRSAPFALALANTLNVKTHIHFDERALGFLALGITKASNNPVVVITTSGSAVGNLLPSVMEAHNTNARLIIISTDRPYELLDCGANQTCMQEHIFSHYTLFSNIDPLSTEVTLDVIANKVNHALLKATSLKEVLHLNVRMREPLYSHTPNITFNAQDFLSCLQYQDRSLIQKVMANESFASFFKEGEFKKLACSFIQVNNTKENPLKEEIKDNKNQDHNENNSNNYESNIFSSQSFSKESFAHNSQVNIFTFLAKLISNPKNTTLALVGDIAHTEQNYLITILNYFNLSAFCDCQSNIVSRQNKEVKESQNQNILDNENVFIGDYDVLLKSNFLKDHQVDNLVIFGGRFISKNLLSFIKDFKGEVYLLNDSLTNLNAQSIKARTLLVSYKELAYLAKIFNNNNKISNNTLVGFNKALGKEYNNLLAKKESYLNSLTNLSEITAIWELRRFLINKSFFIGNSLAIRVADLLFMPKKIYSSRGVSGIDGQIATASGVYLGLAGKEQEEGLITILGDTTALYDLSSIALLKGQNHKLIILNNNGGKIFTKFAVNDERILEKFFINPSNANFYGVCEMFNIPYKSPTSKSEYQELLKTDTKGPMVIELKLSSDCFKEIEDYFSVFK